MTSLTGHPSWVDRVEFAQLMSHPALALTVPRHPSILGWRLSVATPDGVLAAGIIAPGTLFEPFDPVTVAKCYRTATPHPAPAPRCLCGLRAVNTVGSLALPAVAARNRQARADTDRLPVIHQVELVDAYDFGCSEEVDGPQWRALKIRIFGENIQLGDKPGTWRARAMRIQPGPAYVPASMPAPTVAAIRDRYSIDVHTVDVVDAPGLVEAVAAILGEPPPPPANPFRARVRPTSPACQCGDTHFGVWGAAGVLAAAGGSVLLQRRSRNVQAPGMWALPGGALRPGETPTNAAVREFAEEVDFGDVEPRFKIVGTHTSMCSGGWTYTTVLSAYKGEGRPAVKPANNESDMVKWVPVGEVGEYRLHPVFAEAWPGLARRIGHFWADLPESSGHPAARPFRVAIICHGNIIRSVIAEHLLTRSLPDAAITSGGIGPDVGYGADPLTIDTLAAHGYDATGHRARKVTAGWFDTHDLILAVDIPVANALRRLAPDTAAHGKIRYLREFDPAALSLEVANPWRGTPEQFEECYVVVEAACRGVAAYVEARCDNT